ncbi:unnamed protein product [Rhizoctonia solani]|uniref:Hypervirulence associated protein TUDOR domain-containing protein n=1 Tax=Rhizoctonia solani TaxID=456999 RepID=A0A8H2ZZB4_9AGAM|nr:unnamed protein product [Rhizoctonia solani]
MAQYQVGQKVKYHAIGTATSATENSSTTGEIVGILTETQPAGTTGSTVKASEEEPRYLIKNDNTGKDTAYKSDAIVEVID